MIDERPDFSDQVIWLAMTGLAKGQGGVLLEHVDLKRFEGRLFLVGRLTHRETSGWTAGAHAVIAWDSVAHYLVFRSHADYEQRTAKPSIVDVLKSLVSSWTVFRIIT